MSTSTLVFILMAYVGIFHWITKRKLVKQIQSLEQDLLTYSEAMSQMVEVQMKAHQKYSSNLADLEERIMDLSVPSQDPDLPLERRHQVLALARQGIALEDIVKRLKAPIGEAELILNLQKYKGGEKSRSARMNQQVSPYV